MTTLALALSLLVPRAAALEVSHPGLHRALAAATVLVAAHDRREVRLLPEDS